MLIANQTWVYSTKARSRSDFYAIIWVGMAYSETIIKSTNSTRSKARNNSENKSYKRRYSYCNGWHWRCRSRRHKSNEKSYCDSVIYGAMWPIWTLNYMGKPMVSSWWPIRTIKSFTKTDDLLYTVQHYKIKTFFK